MEDISLKILDEVDQHFRHDISNLEVDVLEMLYLKNITE